MASLAADLAAVTATARSQLAVDLGALGGTRTPSLLIRSVCHGSLLPGHMPPGLRGCRSLPCIVCRSFAVLYGQNQTIGRAHGSGGGRSAVRLAVLMTSRSDAWSASGPGQSRQGERGSELLRSRYSWVLDSPHGRAKRQREPDPCWRAGFA